MHNCEVIIRNARYYRCCRQLLPDCAKSPHSSSKHQECFRKRQNLVEMMGAKHLSGGEIAANRFGELGKGGRFLGIERVMDAKKTHGWRLAIRLSAAATLAAIMKSSIKRWDSVCDLWDMAMALPVSSITTRRSFRFSASGSRSCRS